MPSARAWRHPGIRVLLRDAGTTENPVRAIRQRAGRLVEHALGLGWEGPPFDMELLASLSGLRIELVDTLGEGREASCIPGAILLSRNSPSNRKRYSIAHEIIHLLVPDSDGSDHIGSLAADVRDAANGELELLCQIGAAELLMPAAAFETAMGTDPPGLVKVGSLSKVFDVSIEAAARRAVDLSTQPMALVMARPSDDAQGSPRARGTGPAKIRARVKHDDLVVTAWVAPPRFCIIRVAIGEPIPRKSQIRRAWGWACYKPRDRRAYSKVESWPAYPELSTFRVEAIPLPLGKRPIEVLGLLAHDLARDPNLPTA